MNTTNCYTAISWRVFQYGRFVGYVIAFSSYDAYRKAKDKFGRDIRIEQVSLDPSSNG